MHITKEIIPVEKIIQEAHSDRSGAVVLFCGDVRNHNEGDLRVVEAIEYEAHVDLAEKAIQNILDAAIKKWDLHKAICIHRIGKLKTSETTIIVLTTSSHREEAYKANRYIIDEVKKDVPVWKKELFIDGKHKWH